MLVMICHRPLWIKRLVSMVHGRWRKVAGCNPRRKIVPKIDKAEPLKVELEHFLDCIKSDKEPLASGYDGIKVLGIAIKAGQVSTTVDDRS